MVQPPQNPWKGLITFKNFKENSEPPTFTNLHHTFQKCGTFLIMSRPPRKKERNTTQQQHMAQVVKKYQTRSCFTMSLPETSPPGTGLFSAPNFLKSWVWLELPKPGSCRSWWTPSTSPSTTEFQTCNTNLPQGMNETRVFHSTSETGKKRTWGIITTKTSVTGTYKESISPPSQSLVRKKNGRPLLWI